MTQSWVLKTGKTNWPPEVIQAVVRTVNRLNTCVCFFPLVNASRHQLWVRSNHQLNNYRSFGCTPTTKRPRGFAYHQATCSIRSSLGPKLLKGFVWIHMELYGFILICIELYWFELFTLNYIDLYWFALMHIVCILNYVDLYQFYGCVFIYI